MAASHPLSPKDKLGKAHEILVPASPRCGDRRLLLLRRDDDVATQDGRGVDVAVEVGAAVNDHVPRLTGNAGYAADLRGALGRTGAIRHERIQAMEGGIALLL